MSALMFMSRSIGQLVIPVGALLGGALAGAVGTAGALAAFASIALAPAAPAWNRAAADSTGHQVLELPAADHGLEVPHDPIASVDTLREVVTRLDGFIGALAP
ncbi:hypothetical protein ACIG5E_26920 [Kitasatospora sp. NPDC053057]|uniref:hypothetical protein n=1 Tax=Kitasatospora sp. NPDC053057 TaxID=3364062 RepID=UPI0037C66E3F